MTVRAGLVAPIVAVLLAGPWSDAAGQVSGEVGVELRGFPSSPVDAGQRRHGASLVLRPELYVEWGRGDQSIVFEPFVRLDAADGRRTHWDVRELFWRRVWRDVELRVGVRRVFWGVTESQHLVDIINQTDLVENVDGEDRLGQAMINVAFMRRWGTIDLFLLPWFRERTYPGRRGRLRAVPLVSHAARFEVDGVRRHLAFAVRWSHTLGDWDLGLAHFYGTARDPRFVPGDPGGTVVVPLYEIVHQTSVDAQWTRGGWLWKFEGLTRRGQGEAYVALTGGFEYTVVGLWGSVADLGLLVEYLYDSRGRGTATPFEDDVFVGARLALNDAQGTDLLAGAIVDRRTRGTVLSLEARRRLGDSWTMGLEMRAFAGVAGTSLGSFRRDHYLQLELTRYF